MVNRKNGRRIDRPSELEPSLAGAGRGRAEADGKERRTERRKPRKRPGPSLRLNTIFTDLNPIEEPRERFGEAAPGTEPRSEEATGTNAGNRGRQKR